MYWKGTTAKNYFNPFAILMGFILTRCSHFLQVLQHLLTFLHSHFFGYMELHSLPTPPPPPLFLFTRKFLIHEKRHMSYSEENKNILWPLAIAGVDHVEKLLPFPYDIFMQDLI